MSSAGLKVFPPTEMGAGPSRGIVDILGDVDVGRKRRAEAYKLPGRGRRSSPELVLKSRSENPGTLNKLVDFD